MTERVVITGIGSVCGAGRTTEDIWQKVSAGETAIDAIERWAVDDWPVRKGAELRGVRDRELVADRKLHKSIRRTDLFGIAAADEAIAQAGLLEARDAMDEDAARAFNARTGVIAGSGGGSYDSNYEYLPLITEAKGELPAFGRELTSTVTPMWLLRNLPNNVVCHVGIRCGFKGTNACVTNEGTSGIQAVVEGAEAIRWDEADRVVAIGHDASLEAETVLRYAQVGLLSPDTLLPFDVRRSGTVLGEGAGAVVVESAASAAARGAEVLADYLGSGCVNEANGVLGVRTDGDGLSRAIELALADAGLSAGDVGMVVAHANGTQNSDASEAAALRRVFGDDIPPMTGFKWSTGHLLAAAGSLDLSLAVRALSAGSVPGIGALQTLDPAFGDLPVSREARAPRSDVALVLCRGFASMNVAVALRAPARS